MNATAKSAKRALVIFGTPKYKVKKTLGENYLSKHAIRLS